MRYRGIFILWVVLFLVISFTAMCVPETIFVCFWWGMSVTTALGIAFLIAFLYDPARKGKWANFPSLGIYATQHVSFISDDGAVRQVKFTYIRRFFNDAQARVVVAGKEFRICWNAAGLSGKMAIKSAVNAYSFTNSVQPYKESEMELTESGVEFGNQDIVLSMPDVKPHRVFIERQWGGSTKVIVDLDDNKRVHLLSSRLIGLEEYLTSECSALGLLPDIFLSTSIEIMIVFKGDPGMVLPTLVRILDNTSTEGSIHPIEKLSAENPVVEELVDMRM